MCVRVLNRTHLTLLRSTYIPFVHVVLDRSQHLLCVLRRLQRNSLAGHEPVDDGAGHLHPLLYRASVPEGRPGQQHKDRGDGQHGRPAVLAVRVDDVHSVCKESRMALSAVPGRGGGSETCERMEEDETVRHGQDGEAQRQVAEEEEEACV